MIQFLKQQEQEQNELRIQNEILAREALLRGFDPVGLEPPATKKGKKTAAKRKAESSNP